MLTKARKARQDAAYKLTFADWELTGAINRMVMDGASQAAIARHFGITRQALSERLAAAGAAHFGMAHLMQWGPRPEYGDESQR